VQFIRSDFFQKGRTLGIIATILLVVAADQLCKWYMLDVVGIATRPPIEVTRFFTLVMVWNYGISFGMFAMPETVMPYVLKALAIMIAAVLWVMSHRTHLRHERFCYAMIIGGALGNVMDRVRFGAVADFFYLHVGNYGWPAFNIADAAIFCGVAYLLLRLLFAR
jgi:signal peptidase II